MFSQNSIGINVESDRISLGWIRGSLKKVYLEAIEAYDHDSESKDDVLSNIDVFLSEFIAKNAINDFSLYIGIPDDLCLEKEIELPFSVRDDIESVLHYEIEKYIPMPASKVVYGYRVISENNSTGKVKVLLQVLKKENLAPFVGLKDFITEGITAIVMTSSAIEEYKAYLESKRKPRIARAEKLADNMDDSGSMPAAALAFQKFIRNKKIINFLPERFRKKPSRLPLITFTVLLVLLFISITIMGSSYYLQDRIQSRQIDERLNELKKQIQKVDKLEDKVTVLEKKNTEIKQIMGDRSSTLEILKELSEVLPKNTSLDEFEYKKRDIRIKGSSKNATRLIEPLETSPLFIKVGFESKITITADRQESFIIKMRHEQNNEK